MVYVKSSNGIRNKNNKRISQNNKIFYQIFFQQAGVANTLIYTKLRDRLQQYSTMEMNDKRRADIQRMKR